MYQDTNTNVHRGKEPVGVGKLWYIHTVGYYMTMEITELEMYLILMKLINNVE